MAKSSSSPAITCRLSRTSALRPAPNIRSPIHGKSARTSTSIGSQYLVGDASNQNPKIPAYWVVNLHSSYKVSEHIELFGLVQNLFDRHYYVHGTFFDIAAVPYLNLTDPRTFVPGMPFAAYVGMRGTL